MQTEERGKITVSSFIAIGSFCSLLVCMLVSGALLSLPLVGGGLYLAAQGTLRFAALIRPARAAEMSRALKGAGASLAAVITGWVVALITAYSEKVKTVGAWPVLGIALCAAARSALTRLAVERAQETAEHKARKALFIFGIQAVFFCLGAPLIWFSPLSHAKRWALLGCWAVSGLPECFPLKRKLCRLSAFTDQDRADRKALRGVHACVIFRGMALAASAAVQAVQVLGCVCIALAIGAPLACMAAALLCAVAVPWLIIAWLNRPRKREPDPNRIIVLGLLIWLTGLFLFMLFPKHPAVSGAALALCCLGAAGCCHALAGLHEDMRRAAAFALGHTPENMDALLETDLRFSALTGGIIGLAALALAALFPAALYACFALPAVALTAAVFVFALLFPLRLLHLRKLRRCVALQEKGIENKPLRRQLEPVVIQKSVKNYGIRLVEFVLRPFFFHRVRGAENIRLDEDIPCVFVCNHGEILGPVVCTLFSPFPFRPWSAYEMLDVSMVAERTMNGTFQGVKGVGRKLLQWLMNRIGAPFLVWLLHSEGSIAVYHDNPHKLMQTFRETIAAMQAGDNILVFPENAETSPDHRYVREGVSEFFTGFTMIGQMFTNKTGDCPLFVPMYADKKKRLITYGTPTRYDAEAPVNEEKDRLCRYLRGEIMRLAGMEDSKR